MEDLTLKVAPSVDATVELRFTTDATHQAHILVDGDEVGVEPTRTFPLGRGLDLFDNRRQLAKALGLSGGVACLSVTDDQKKQYRQWRHDARGTEECVMDGCHADAHMQGDFGPVCTRHYDA